MRLTQLESIVTGGDILESLTNLSSISPAEASDFSDEINEEISLFCDSLRNLSSSLSDLTEEINEESCLFRDSLRSLSSFLLSLSSSLSDLTEEICESSLCSNLLLFSLCSCLSSFSLFTCTSIKLYERNGQKQYGKSNASLRVRRTFLKKC